MMSNSVNEKMISFKELEKKIFLYVCELGCEITGMINLRKRATIESP